MRHKKSIGEYLAFLSVKYEVNPEKFLHALRRAQSRKSNCGNLSIQCRGRIKTKLIFLIMRGSEVVAQFPMNTDFLLNKSNQLGNFMGTDKIRSYLSKKNRTSPVYSIRDVRVGMRHVNLKAEVVEVEKSKHIVTRYGNSAVFTKVLIKDGTGTIKLCLWNGQIDGVSVGDVVQIKNAQVARFRGEQFLSLGKKGTIENEVLETPTEIGGATKRRYVKN